MAAPTILSAKAARTAPPDLSAESVDFLVRERGIMEAARYGFNRDVAKRLIFTGWRIRRPDQTEDQP